MQVIPFDAYLGASKTGLAIGAIIYELDGSTVNTAFSTSGFYEAPAGSGAWHNPGLSLPDAGGVIAVGISGTEYMRVGVESAEGVAPTVSAIDTYLSGIHGSGSWITATGFATPANVTSAQSAILAAIAALNNLSLTDITNRLNLYDGATGADLTAAQAVVTAAIAALNNVSTSDLLAAANAATPTVTLANDAITENKISTGAIIEIQTGLATSTALTALSTKIGTPVAATVSDDIAAIKDDTEEILTTGVTATLGPNSITATVLDSTAITEIQNGLATLASIAALNNLSTGDVTTLVTNAINAAALATASALAALSNKLGNPIGLTFSADIDAIKDDTEAIILDLSNGVSVSSLGSNVITAASVATDAVTEIQNGLATLASVAALNNLSSAQVTTIITNAFTAAALATASALTALSNKVGTPEGATLSIDVAAIKNDTEQILLGVPSTGFAANSITAAVIAPDAITEIQTGLATSASIATLATAAALAAVSTKIGTPVGASIAIDIAAARTVINAIQSQIGTNGAGLTALASAANLATLITYVDTEILAIKNKTDTLPSSPAATGDIPNTAAIALAVWTYITRTLTSGGGGEGATPQEIWEYAERTLTSGGGGGDGDSSEEIWTYITRTLTSLGSASGIIYTYTITNSISGLPISGVSVWFATNSTFNNVVWVGTTDDFGVAIDINGNKPRLDVGTYFILCRKVGYVFTVDMETVSI